MNLKKILSLLLVFMFSFLTFNSDAFADFQAEEWKEKNKNGYYCIYSFSDSGNTSRKFYMLFTNDNGNAVLEDAKCPHQGLYCGPTCQRRSNTAVKSHFKMDSGKLYCPQYFYYCDTSGNDNYVFSDQKEGVCYAKGSDNGKAEHDRYVMTLSEHSSKAAGYNNGDNVEIPANTAQTFPTLPSCQIGGVNAANNTVNKIKSISQQIENYNPGNKNSTQIKSDLSNFGTTLAGIDIEGKSYCDISGFTTTDASKNLQKLLDEVNNKITAKTQQLEKSGKISSQDSNQILEKFQYSGIKYTDREYTCEQLLDSDLQLVIKKSLSWMQIIAPIILIVLTSVDFAQAVISQDQDATKKATSKVLKRVIAAVALFFIPFLVKVIMGWAGFFETCGL